MIEDQMHILSQITEIIQKEQIDGVLISGDIYDRSIPKAEAISLFNSFLTGIAQMDISIFLIAGNHDSGERLDFGNELFAKQNVFVVGSLQDNITTYKMKDKYGTVTITLLPFFKPAIVKHRYEDDSIQSYEQAFAKIVDEITLDRSNRNILMAHHFFTSIKGEVECSDSELPLSVGGTDNIDVKVLEPFDYVALGHIHRAQKVGPDTIRYAGSPLKYSFSEEFHKKSVTIIELKEKGNIEISQVLLSPLRDMRRIRGKLIDLISDEVVNLANPEDYLGVTLLDEDEIYDPMNTLRRYYPNVMQIIFEKLTVKKETFILSEHEAREKSPMELMEHFFEYVTEREFDSRRKTVIANIIDKELENRS